MVWTTPCTCTHSQSSWPLASRSKVVHCGAGSGAWPRIRIDLGRSPGALRSVATAPVAGKLSTFTAKTDGSPATQGAFTVTRPLLPQLAALGYVPADITYLALSHNLRSPLSSCRRASFRDFVKGLRSGTLIPAS